MLTEKFAVKKELDRMDHLYSKSKKDLKEKNIQYNLKVDEADKANKMNN